MKFKMFALAGVALFGLSACSATHQGVASAPLVSYLESNQVANIQTGQKVSAESSAKVILGFITLSEDNKYADGVNYAGASALSGFSLLDSTSPVKSAAAYKALKKSNADVLVAPIYETEVDNYFLWKDVKAKVSAYSGKISGFKNTERKVAK